MTKRVVGPQVEIVLHKWFMRFNISPEINEI
jgi:hypothetical protein